MKKFLLLYISVGFSWHSLWAADLQNTQCDIDINYYSEKPSVKKAEEAVRRKDMTAAIKFYKIAALEENNPWAKVMLGSYYLNGDGVQKNVAEAFRLIKSAADQGDGWGQIHVGLYHHWGMGVAQNYEEAVRWFKLASSKGCPFAWRLLSEMYQYGKGVPQDYVKAHMWINLYAAKSADTSDGNDRDKLAKKLTPEQLNQAQQLATRCQAQSFKNCD